MLSAEKENEPELQKEPIHSCRSNSVFNVYFMGIVFRNTKCPILLWLPLCFPGENHVLGKYFAPCCYIRLGGIMDVEKKKLLFKSWLMGCLFVLYCTPF